MQTQSFRLVVCSIIASLTFLNLAVVSSPASGENGAHFCGFTGQQPDNRRFARSLANLNVGEPRAVRMIYFLPNDRPYRVEVVQRMKDEILKVQTFFAEQMDAHGYGKRTFRVETSAQGEPIVHRVEGGHPDSLYDNNPGTQSFREIEQAGFNLTRNVHLIVEDISSNLIRDAAGVGTSLGKNGGYALVPGSFEFVVVAHEMGHAFGLEHDFRDGAYIMSYGPGRSRLSACAARFLAMHPYFNPGIPTERVQPPTVELISPHTYPVGSSSVPVRLQVNDSEGLHHLFLIAHSGLQTCRGLAGERDALVEFNYDGAFVIQGFYSLSDSVTHPITALVIDTDGNVSESSINLTEYSSYHIDTLKGHRDSVRTVSFSDSGALASGSKDRTIRLWNVAARQNVAILYGHTHWVESVSFSDEGTLASGSEDGTVKLWDVAAEHEITTFRHAGWVSSVSILPDGRTVASGSGDGTVRLWDVATKQNFTTLTHGNPVSCVSFSSDGPTLAFGSVDGTVKLWDVAAERDITMFRHTDWVSSVSFSSDGLTLASGSGDGTVKLRDVITQQNMGILLHGSGVISVSFSRDGRTLASGAADGTLKLWDVASGANFATFGNVGTINSVSFSPEGGTLAAGTAEGTIALWDVTGLMDERLEATTEIDIPDSNLRAAIATTLGKSPSASIVRGNMVTLTKLEASAAGIRNLAVLEHASDLTFLNIRDNNISDIAPLVANTGLSSGDEVHIQGNPLSYTSIYTHIPALQERGVEVFFDHRTPQRIRIILGDNQQGLPDAVLEKPFVVEVRDENSVAFEGVPVMFTVASGGGSLGATTATTDSNGRAESVLTLGPDPGTNTVEVAVTGIQKIQTVTAIVKSPPEAISISDPNLDTAVRERLGIASSDAMTQYTMLRLENLNADGRRITDLVGIKGATNLMTLHLGNNSISDISALAGLTSLTWLYLWYNDISDISAVTGLTKLTELYLDNNSITNISAVSGLTNLKTLVLWNNSISDISAVGSLTNLTFLSLWSNAISDMSAVEDLTNLTSLNIGYNSISDISPLVANTGLGSGDKVDIRGNPLSHASIFSHIPALQERGVEVNFDKRTPHKSRIVLGDDQEGLPGEALAKPYVVEVRDENNIAFEGVPVEFTVSSGSGSLSVTSVTTDSNGRAESILTLGPNPGENTVTVSVTGIQEEQTFTAEGIRIPKVFWIVAGFDQKGLTGEVLPNPIVVEVRDQAGEPLPGAQVTFAVSSGGGTLSVTSTTTDSDGRAESTLTLGPQPGTNSVEVAVAGIQQIQTATAIGELPPKPEDVNRDDVVNILDLVLVASVLGDEGADLAADVNGDGIVNILDLVRVAGALGNAAVAPSAWYRDLEIAPTGADVGEWLAQVQGLGLTDATWQRGVLFLEQRLAVMTPEETVLLPNYPNPFNPETWIPYRLAEDAVVTLAIYDASGGIVRRLDLGHRLAGFYESRSEAIYWDGRNDSGEGVASGVYFYRLSADSYSATRKMLIIK